MPDEYHLKKDEPAARPLPPAVSEITEFMPVMGAARAPGNKPRRTAASDFWALMGCNAIVFGASVCIMILELTASRLIAMHLGQSLYTWTSVIGVVLAGISFGNYLGGWLADRYEPRKVLGYLFLISGLLTFSVLWLNQWASNTARPDSVQWQFWVMLVVAWIFLPPSLALGTISPVTASMALSRSEKTGMTVGNVYAWGAMGSIVGTFLAGFYLIDVCGTKAIITLTASALLVMGALVAGGQWAFRAAVIFGALQFVTLIGLCAWADAEKLAAISRGYARATSFTVSEKDPKKLERSRNEREKSWDAWGRKLAGHLHSLGMTLALRNDDPGEYHDESNYYAINVSYTSQEDEPVKELKLDHLIHSYYNPENPLKLYYDYEKVYAAITERASSRWDRPIETDLAEPPVADFAKSLPSTVTYDAARKLLAVRGAMDFAQFRSLASIGPRAPFREAVLKAWQQSNSNAGGFITVPLETLPDGAAFPKELESRVHYDATLRAIIVSSRLNLDDAVNIAASGKDAPYMRAIYDLYQRSRSTSTMFIGGGGFVFPRWIEVMFPHNPVIDVAEIDPAVKDAVQAQMGLPDDEHTAVRTHIGDARKFVDDRRRENDALRQAGQPPVLYDFVYGDAFNDFSVPWHLTTLEFSRKIKELLTPQEGVYLVNIIDIYPRAEFPVEGDKDPETKKRRLFDHAPPAALLSPDVSDFGWTNSPPPFHSFELNREGDRGYLLGFRGIMSIKMRDELLKLAPQDEGFEQAVRELHRQSGAHKAGGFLGRYVKTAREVFPYVYLFSGNENAPGDNRDTFVVACSLKKLDLNDLQKSGGHWKGRPFAWTETDGQDKHDEGQMPAVLELARDTLLTDDFAPVDNLLAPVFVSQ